MWVGTFLQVGSCQRSNVCGNPPGRLFLWGLDNAKMGRWVLGFGQEQCSQLADDSFSLRVFVGEAVKGNNSLESLLRTPLLCIPLRVCLNEVTRSLLKMAETWADLGPQWGALCFRLFLVCANQKESVRHFQAPKGLSWPAAICIATSSYKHL